MGKDFTVSSYVRGMDTAGILDHLQDSELKNGEAIFLLLKFGETVYKLSQILNLKNGTIEARLLEYLKEGSKSPEEDCEYLFFEVSGLPKLDILKRYVQSDLLREEFSRTYRIDGEKWKRILVWEEFECVKQALEEKRIKDDRINGNHTLAFTNFKRYPKIKISGIGLPKF